MMDTHTYLEIPDNVVWLLLSQGVTSVRICMYVCVCVCVCIHHSGDKSNLIFASISGRIRSSEGRR